LEMLHIEGVHEDQTAETDRREYTMVGLQGYLEQSVEPCVVGGRSCRER
jgi:hypothetical protein